MSSLRDIPGVGIKTIEILHSLGIYKVDDLKNIDPEVLYLKDCQLRGFKTDRCQLYLYRCAVYYATHIHHDPKKLKWWYWKDVE